jgi:integrase
MHVRVAQGDGWPGQIDQRPSSGRKTSSLTRLSLENPREFYRGDKRVARYRETVRPDDYVFVNPRTKSCLQETKTAFHRACRIAGILGLIWKDLRATFRTRLAETGCDSFTIAQLLGHSDVRVTMRYVRMVEGSKRVAVEAMKLTFGKVGHIFGHLAKNSHRCRRLKMVENNWWSRGGSNP